MYFRLAIPSYFQHMVAFYCNQASIKLKISLKVVGRYCKFCEKKNNFLLFQVSSYFTNLPPLLKNATQTDS